MISVVAVAPPRTQRVHIAAAIRVLDESPQMPGAAGVVQQLTALNNQQAWSPRSIRGACAGLRAFRRLFLHQASTEYWLGQIAGPVRGAEDPAQVELASTIAAQRGVQAATLGVALEVLEGVLNAEVEPWTL